VEQRLSLTVQTHPDLKGYTLIVTEAGNPILVDFEVWHAIERSKQTPSSSYVGAAKIERDRISFGTPGMGLGVVTYERHTINADGFYVCTKVVPNVAKKYAGIEAYWTEDEMP
jgi:hypothetical protein